MGGPLPEIEEEEEEGCLNKQANSPTTISLSPKIRKEKIAINPFLLSPPSHRREGGKGEPDFLDPIYSISSDTCGPRRDGYIAV